MSGTHCYAITVVAATLLTIIFKPKTLAPVARRIKSSQRHELKSKFFRIFFLPDTLAVRFIGSSFTLVLQAPVVVFTNLYQSLRVTKHGNLIIEGCYELMC